jgi:hypothetical protein
MNGDERPATAREREIRRMAGHIKDEAQLEQIVAAATPAMQNAVRDLLKQYVRYTTEPDAA